jgi:transglutaminase-like putative cysteine protease
MGLAVFDGVSWSPQREQLGNEPQTPTGAQSTGHAVRQRFTIANLAGHLVPSAAYPTTVSPSAVLFTAQSQGLLVPSTQLQAGDSVMVWSNIAPLSAAKLRKATSSAPPPGPYLDLPPIPAAVAETARSVTANARTPYERMLALQQWFRTQFAYDRTVQFGGGTGAIVDFLEAKRGFCQQFSATFAAMARTLGVPSRVGVGFTPGVLGSDGRYHVYGRHAHAWPEVWFDGIGWVAFEPTPGRGNPDTTSVSGVPFQQDEAPVDTTPVTSTTLAPTTTRPGTRPTTSVSRPSTTSTQRSSGSNTSAWAVWLLVVAAAVAAVAVVMVRRRRPSRSMTPAGRVDRAWSTAVRMMVRQGAPPIGGATPLEYAKSSTELADLAALVTRCVYAPESTSDDDAEQAERLVDVLTSSLRERRRQP